MQQRIQLGPVWAKNVRGWIGWPKSSSPLWHLGWLLLTLGLLIGAFGPSSGVYAGAIPIGGNKTITDAGLNGAAIETPDLVIRGNERYVVWADKRNEDTLGFYQTIYFAKSTDGGQSWGTNVRVSAADYDDWCDHPQIAVAADGTIWVAYGKEWLAKVDNIIATLFLAEAHYDLPMLMEKLLNLYDTEPDRQAVMLFVNWFRQLAAHGRLKSTDFAQIEEQYLTREEIKSMLVKALEREREASRQQGIDIGKKEGIEERNRQVAQSMVANGFALPTIAQLLDLPVTTVEQLLAEHGQDNSTTTAPV